MNNEQTLKEKIDLQQKSAAMLFETLGREWRDTQLAWRFRGSGGVMSSESAQEAKADWITNISAIQSDLFNPATNILRMVKAEDAYTVTLIDGLSTEIDSQQATDLVDLFRKALAKKVLNSDLTSAGASLVTSAIATTGHVIVSFAETAGVTVADMKQLSPEYAAIIDAMANEYLFVSPTSERYAKIEGYEVETDVVRHTKPTKISMDKLWLALKAKARMKGSIDREKLKRMNVDENPVIQDPIAPPLERRVEKGDISGSEESITAANDGMAAAIILKANVGLMVDGIKNKNHKKHFKKFMSIMMDNAIPGFTGMASWIYAVAAEESRCTPGIKEVLQSGKPGSSEGFMQIQKPQRKFSYPSWEPGNYEVYIRAEAKSALFLMNDLWRRINAMYVIPADRSHPLLVNRDASTTSQVAAAKSLKYMRSQLNGPQDSAIECWYLMAMAWGDGHPYPIKAESFKIHENMRKAVTLATLYSYVHRLPAVQGLI